MYVSCFLEPFQMAHFIFLSQPFLFPFLSLLLRVFNFSLQSCLFSWPLGRHFGMNDAGICFIYGFFFVVVKKTSRQCIFYIYHRNRLDSFCAWLHTTFLRLSKMIRQASSFHLVSIVFLFTPLPLEDEYYKKVSLKQF